jgi:hypothetical protein
VKTSIPEFWQVEEHLEIAIHVACIALVDEPQVVSRYLLFLSQRQTHEEVRVHHLYFDPSNLIPFLLAEDLARGLDMFVRYAVLGQPAASTMDDNHGFKSLVDDDFLRQSHPASHTVLLITDLNLKW